MKMGTRYDFRDPLKKETQNYIEISSSFSVTSYIHFSQVKLMLEVLSLTSESMLFISSHKREVSLSKQWLIWISLNGVTRISV